MALMIIGMVIFFGVHALPWAPELRDRLMNRLGEGAYRGLFSLISLAGFAVLVTGYGRADFISLWDSIPGGRMAAIVLMPVFFVLLVAANSKSNIKRYTRHPMAWGIVGWSVLHLLNRGDLAALLLFGGLAVYVSMDMVICNRRGAAFSTAKAPVIRDAMNVGIGLALYAVFLLFLHQWLFGIDPLA